MTRSFAAGGVDGAALAALVGAGVPVGGAAVGDGVLAAAMVEQLRQTLVNGCDPSHPGYWGDIDARSTLICEGADIALAVWLGREILWPRLAAEQQWRVRQWLGQAIGRDTADNN